MSKAKKDGLQRTPKCAIVLSNAVAIQFTPACVVDTEEDRESGQDGKSSLQQVTAMELFEAFKRENKALHTRVNESLEELRLSGWIEPYTILIKGPNEDLELVRETWKRHLLRSPNKFVIRDVGEISSIGMDVIQQAPFMPLTKALHEAIKSMNESKETATQESIAKFLRENYQYVHIPSMNIIYDCLGLLIKERIVYHTGNGYFINTHNRTGKSAETSNVTSEGSANKENDSEVVTKKKAVSESPGNSNKNNHEKLKQTGDSKPQRHTRRLLDANGKVLDKKHNKESEHSAVSQKSRIRREPTESEQMAGKDSKSTEPSPPFSNSDKAERENKQQTDANSGQSESSGSQSDEGRIKRGFLGRMSGRRAKADKEKSSEEESKRSKDKKGVLNQLACFIKNRSMSGDVASGSSANTNSHSWSPVQPSVTGETREQISQSYTPDEHDVSFTKEERSPRNSPGQMQRDASVTRKQYDEENESTSPTFTRSRSFVTASRKRPGEVTRSNSFTSNRINKRKEQTVLPNMDHENISFSAWTSSISTSHKGPCAVGVVHAPHKGPCAVGVVHAPHKGPCAVGVVHAPHKGPCAVGVVRPISRHPGSQNGHVQRRPQSASSSGRSISFKETTRPYSVPHASDLSRESWSKFPKGDRGMTRSKSFGNTQKERNIPSEKSSRVGERKLHPGIMPPQNYSAYSNICPSLNGPRMRTLAVPIKGKYGNLPNMTHRKSTPRASARQKTTPIGKKNIDTSIGEYSQHAHGTDAYCTSPICNDKCRINELKPMNCKCNEHEEGLAGDAYTNKSESNDVSAPRPFEKVLQNDVSCLTERIDSADICLDEVSSTSGSEFAAEMKVEAKQPAYILGRTAAGQSEQTPYCVPCQFTPEEAKINSSLTFIGII